MVYELPAFGGKRHAEVTVINLIDLVAIPVGLMKANCCILSLNGREDCVVVDPGGDKKAILRAAAGKKIAGVLLTHGHIDHIAAVDDITPEDSPLYIHPEDENMLRNPKGNLSSMVGLRFTVNHSTLPVCEGDVLELAGMSITVLHTPGHTPGSVCYLAGEHLISGDTLFYRGYGRTDFPGGSWERLYESLKRLIRLPAELEVHPGHGQSTTIGECRGHCAPGMQ